MTQNALPPPIVILGEALMDCIALTDNTKQTGAFKPHLGGSPYNVARAIARQGGQVWFLNPLSTDDFGKQLSAQHAQEGVRQGLQHNNLPTSLAMVSFVAGQPSYQFYRDGVADRAFNCDDALAFLAQFAKPGILHTGSLALVPPEAEKTLAIVQAAKALGWTISVDVNVRVRLARDLMEYRIALLSLMQLADWVKASDEDLEHIMQVDSFLGRLENDALTLDQAPQLAQKLRRAGVDKIALTFGGQGAYLLCGADGAQGAAPSVKVIDTVGAGDTFWGTCLRLWSENSTYPSAEVLSIAMRAAAINCTFAGCNPPNLDTLNSTF